MATSNSIMDDVKAIRERMEEINPKTKSGTTGTLTLPKGKQGILSQVATGGIKGLGFGHPGDSIQPGEMVTCEFGHAITTVATRLPQYGKPLTVGHFVGGWCSGKDLAKPCNCGGRWWQDVSGKRYIHILNRYWVEVT